MTYEELVQEAKKIYEPADAGSIKEHVAYQFNIKGEAEGAFYLEVSDGKVHVEPYEYYDRDVLFTTTVETLMKIGTGKLDPVFAYTTGKLKVEGNMEKALLLKNLSGAKQEGTEKAAAEGTPDCRKAEVKEPDACAEPATAVSEAAGAKIEPCKEGQTGNVTEPCETEGKTETLKASAAETETEVDEEVAAVTESAEKANTEAGSIASQSGKDSSKWPNRKKKKK